MKIPVLGNYLEYERSEFVCLGGKNGGLRIYFISYVLCADDLFLDEDCPWLPRYLPHFEILGIKKGFKRTLKKLVCCV